MMCSSNPMKGPLVIILTLLSACSAPVLRPMPLSASEWMQDNLTSVAT